MHESDFEEIVASLQKPQYILFVDLDSDDSYRHDQSDGEIIIPPIGAEFYATTTRYIVKSVTFAEDCVIVRINNQ